MVKYKYMENKQTYIAVAIAILVIAFFLGGAFAPNFLANTTNQQLIVEEPTTNPPANDNELLVINDTVVGTGQEANVGDTVSVHYVGSLQDGTVFDASRPRGQAFEFTLGERRVIEGWEKGVVGMKVGGTRMLTIAPEMAYGTQEIANPQTGEVLIPANSTLVFEVELLEVNK